MNSRPDLIKEFMDGNCNHEEFLSRFFSLLKDIPIKKTDRNDAIRKDILVRMLSAFLTDDERAEFLNLPPGCRIREGAKIISPENLTIGENCWIGENAILDASGGLEIGSGTSIGLGVYVWSHSSHMANLKNQNEIGSKLIKRKKTTIGSNCFIGGPSVILPGITIGDKCIIRPMSFITEDVPPRTVV